MLRDTQLLNYERLPNVTEGDDMFGLLKDIAHTALQRRWQLLIELMVLARVQVEHYGNPHNSAKPGDGTFADGTTSVRHVDMNQVNLMSRFENNKRDKSPDQREETENRS